jgi:hypothetical protein
MSGLNTALLYQEYIIIILRFDMSHVPCIVNPVRFINTPTNALEFINVILLLGR